MFLGLYDNYIRFIILYILIFIAGHTLSDELIPNIIFLTDNINVLISPN